MDDISAKFERLEQVMGNLATTVQELTNESVNGRTTRQEIVKTSPDSITLGAPTNGQIKVYGDFGRPEEFARKIQTAQKLLSDAIQTSGDKKAQ